MNQKIDDIARELEAELRRLDSISGKIFGKVPLSETWSELDGVSRRLHNLQLRLTTIAEATQ